MAVANSLRKPQEKKNAQLVSFQANGATVELSPQIVRDYLVSGDKERVSMQEIVMFINLCKFNGLNPWLREAYCIKYGNEPATMVTGKEAFEKRAENHPQHDGHRAGIIVYDEETGELTYRVGAFYIAGEKIVGGWAEVYRKDQRQSTRVEVPFDEYAGRKKDGSLNSQWSAKPATMIRKVALVQALREAFPQTFGGMYDADEVGVDSGVLDAAPIVPLVPDAIDADPATGEAVLPSAPADDPTSKFFDA